MKLWGLEPAMIIGAIAAVLSLLVAFGVPVTGEQQEAIKDVAITFIPILAAWFIRQQVIPTAKVEAAHGILAVQQAKDVKKSEIGTAAQPHDPRDSA